MSMVKLLALWGASVLALLLGALGVGQAIDWIGAAVPLVQTQAFIALASVCGIHVAFLAAARMYVRMGHAEAKMPTVLECVCIMAPFFLWCGETGGGRKAFEVVTGTDATAALLRFVVGVLVYSSTPMVVMLIPTMMVTCVLGVVSLVGINWGGPLTWEAKERACRAQQLGIEKDSAEGKFFNKILGLARP